MNKFKLFFCIINILIIGCQCDNKNDIALVNVFVNDIKTSDKENIYNKYFLFNEQKDDSIRIRRKVYYDLIDAIKGDLKNNNKYQILSYAKAKSKYKDIDRINNNNELVYVIFIKPIDLIYVKIEKDKIYSIVRLTKGNTIIGWL